MMIYTVALLNLFFVFNLKLVSFDQSLCTLLFCACGIWKLLHKSGDFCSGIEGFLFS